MDDLELIKEKIKFLEEQLSYLRKRIEKYEKFNNSQIIVRKDVESNGTENETNFHEPQLVPVICHIDLEHMKIDTDNKEKYIDYFVNVAGGNKKTAIRHIEQLKAWKKRLVEDLKLSIVQDVYLFDDPLLFYELINYFESNQEMMIKNTEKHHYFYSAAYNWFNKFLHWKHKNNTHENISSIGEKIDLNFHEEYDVDHCPSIEEN